MSVDVTISLQNLERVREALNRLSGKQAKEAYALALNDTGGKLQRAMRTELRTVFDRTTNYIANSPWVERATAEKLSVAVSPRKASSRAGVNPEKVLQAQEFGGRRADKRMEIALKARALLPSGMQVALPAVQYGGPYPGSDDGNGNFTGAFVKRVLGYFNSSARRNTRRYSYASNMRTRREIKLMDGREWFVSLGGRSGLGPGIWARGPDGVRCAVVFTRPASYTKPLLSMKRLARAQNLQPYLDKRIRYRVRQAAGV